ncbi:MAG: YCF48-related protein [Chitinophagales bacterium]
MCTFMLSSVSHSQSLRQFSLPVNTSIRAIAVLNDSTMWFAGSNGCFGYTEDDGKHWHIDSIKIEGRYPDFRSLSVIDQQTVLLLNAGSPAYLLKSTDHAESWKTVYSNEKKEIFFDSMKFRDAKNGMAVGDPIDGCFTILTTDDGGDNWKEISCDRLPQAMAGEACFASGNTCAEQIENYTWIGTGGAEARVLSSTDYGATWHYTSTPLLFGKQLTGIFSIDFYDRQHGIIAGGDYENKTESLHSKAISNNGGKSWKPVADFEMPGFCSCVQYQPFSHAKTLLITAHPGLYISNNAGKKWAEVKDDDGKALLENYNTIQFSPTGKVAWFAGTDGRTGRIVFNK